jgi:hypothetical protein
MLARWLCFLTLLGLTVLPAPARAADDKTVTPTLQVRLRSIDGLLEDLKYMAKTTGGEDDAAKLDTSLKQMLPNGFEGIDTKKPLGAYVVLDPNITDSSGVIFVPASDEKSFIGLVERLAQVKATKDGAYYVIQHQAVPVPFFVRFKDGYACITGQEKRSLEDGKLIAPTVFFGKPQTATASLRFQIDQVPDGFKQIMLSQMEVQISNQEEQKIPGETPIQRSSRVVATKAMGQLVTALLQDGKEFGFDFDISSKREAISMLLDITGKPKSPLAASIAAMGQRPSLFAGWVKPDSGFHMIVHGQLPEPGQKILDAVFKAFLEGVKSGPVGLDKAVQEAFGPTITAADFDIGVDFRGPSSAGQYGAIVGVKVVDGDKVEKTIKDFVAKADKGKDMLKFGATTIGGQQVHRLDVQKDFDNNTRAVLGDNPVYFAFRKDAMFFALGDKGLEGLGEALQGKAQKAAVVMGEVNLGKLVDLMKKDNPKADTLAKQVFTKPGSDVVRVNVEGGEALYFRIELKTAVIKFLSKLDADKGAKPAEKKN